MIQTHGGSVVVDTAHSVVQLYCSKHSYQLPIHIRCNSLPDKQYTHQFQVSHCTHKHQHFLNNHILENKQVITRCVHTCNHCDHVVRLLLVPAKAKLEIVLGGICIKHIRMFHKINNQMFEYFF